MKTLNILPEKFFKSLTQKQCNRGNSHRCHSIDQSLPFDDIVHTAHLVINKIYLARNSAQQKKNDENVKFIDSSTLHKITWIPAQIHVGTFITHFNVRRGDLLATLSIVEFYKFDRTFMRSCYMR